MRVVVLGARGFVAHALIAGINEEGSNVLGISAGDLDLLGSDAPARLAQRLQPDDALVVTSALTPDKGRDIATLMKNLKMVEHVAVAVAQSPCRHVVYISSDAVYPTLPSAITEQSLASPTDLYSVMHVARESMLAQVTQERNIAFCILRPCAIYGATDTHNSYGPNRFMRSALTDGVIKLFGEGEEQRDHIYIDDVVRAIVLALANATTGVLNVVSGSAVSFRTVAEVVARAVGGVTIQTAPRGGPVTHRHFDAARLRTTFPGLRITPLDEGISRSIEASRATA